MTEPKTENNRGALSRIRLSRALYPIAIGLGVVGYMLWRDFDTDVFSDVRFTWRSVFWLFMAVLFMFGRDLVISSGFGSSAATSSRGFRPSASSCFGSLPRP